MTQQEERAGWSYEPAQNPYEECPVHGKKLKGTSCSGYGETLVKDYPPLYGSKKLETSETDHRPIQKVPG